MGEESGSAGGPAPRNIGDLAAQLLELSRRDPAAWSERVKRLTVRELAELALQLPARRRADLVLHAPRPMRLVRALPDVDFYLTVREIGPADSAPLLALASTAQLLHLVDLESWRGDRFDADRCGAWIALLLEAGEPPVRRFLKWADDELLSLLFQRWMRVAQMEYEDGAQKHGHGEGDHGTELGLPTPDGEHRFRPTIAEHTPAIRRLLQVFYVEMPDRYRRVLWGALWELPAELEEQALHWRDSRLAEHGFPPLDEAIEVYAAPSGARVHPRPERPIDPDAVHAARTPLLVTTRDQPLALALSELDDASRDRLLHEWISLANHLLIADRADTGDPEAHRAAIDKAAGFVRIALEQRGGVAPDRARRALDERPLLELFREGWARAIDLHRTARALADDTELFDSPIRERIEALLAPRPLYVPLADDEATGLPREFRTLREIEETEVALEMARAAHSLLLDRLGFDPRHPEALRGTCGGPPPRLSTLLLTLMAWQAVEGELIGRPLPQETASTFVRNVASRRTAAPDAAERALTQLVDAVHGRFGLSVREASVLMGFGRFCLVRLAGECGSLDPGVPIDPRFVGCLLLEPVTPP